MSQTKIIGGGVVSPGVEWGLDPTFQAAHISLRPFDYAQFGQVLGHYRISGTAVGQLWGANAILFNIRWGDPSRFFVLQRLSAIVTTTSAITAQRIDPLSATVQRGYTAGETTLLGNIVPTGNTGKARINMGSSLVSQMNVTSGPAGLSGGTRTADNTSFALLPVNGLGAAGTATQMDDFIRADQFGMHPLVLSTNEGMTVSWGATALATGLATFTIIVSWAEVVVF